MKQPFKKMIPGRLLALLLVLLLLAGCGAPAEQLQGMVPTTGQPGTSATDPSVDPSLPPQQDPHDEPPVSTTPTQPVNTQPTVPTTQPVTTLPPVTQPVTTLPPVTQPEPTVPPVTQPTGSSFTVHFIDVGQADAALVLCDGQAMLIDGGNADDSSLMYSYLNRLGITYLDYVIGTHAHEDHIGGIAGALNFATVGQVFCPVTSYSTRAFSNFVKATQKHGRSITVPSVGDRFNLGSASCQVLGVNSTDDTNESSIVLKITYGNTSFLFTGDAEREAENMILNRGYDLHSDVLKVGHHGSASSTGYYWLRQIAPEYAVISVGKGNSYGHPTETVLSRLRDADVTTYRTDLHGDIICTSDGQSVSFQVSKNTSADPFGGIGGNSTQSGGSDGTAQSYILNTNTMKFHNPGCSSASKISSKNRKTYTGFREDLIAQGYDPCGNCHP